MGGPSVAEFSPVTALQNPHRGLAPIENSEALDRHRFGHVCHRPLRAKHRMQIGSDFVGNRGREWNCAVAVESSDHSALGVDDHAVEYARFDLAGSGVQRSLLRSRDR